MKGIILAGGSGTRLYPVTKTICKQLLPVYDKPMIYYPLSVLMLAGIKEILIISTPRDLPCFENLFGDGKYLGLEIKYAEQKEPKGLADAFIVGEEFINGDDVCLILGDNIFYGQGLVSILKDVVDSKEAATIFGYYVNDPERYGVIEFDENVKPVSIEEKPADPKSNYAVVGLYFFNRNVVQYAKEVKPSARGEVEITDIINRYMNEGLLQAKIFGRGFAWLDTGTMESMADAAMYVKAIEDRQGLKIACIEEVALRMGYIDVEQLKNIAEGMNNSDYGKYLVRIAGELNDGVIS